ncbi:MAG: outer membrane beta-barrel protein [Akkermansiaceae bacterium]
MKLKTITAITGLALVATAQAGEEAAAKHVIAPIAPLCNWSWFAGGSVGVIDGDDWDEEIYTLHLGKERKCEGDKCSQAVYLEVGFTENDSTDVETIVGEVTTITTTTTDIEIIPITLNYKYECELSDKLNWYAGAGAGIALVDADIDTTVSGDNAPTSESDDDEAFYAHIFAGLVYNVSDAVEVYGGARLILMDDVLGEDSPLDEELHYEIGARYNF